MQGFVLRLLIKSSNFTYEMVHIQGKTAMDGNVIKLAPWPSREGNKILKEPLKKRRHLVR
ncbi:hypothetical protein D3Z45_13810 [Lachnospiraceae bacterium]|nr:hypothetical protein [Lachnospiraceae bacterium]